MSQGAEQFSARHGGQQSIRRTENDTLTQSAEQYAFDGKHLKTFISSLECPPLSINEAIITLRSQSDREDSHVRLVICHKEGRKALVIQDSQNNQEVKEWFPVCIIRAPTCKYGGPDESMANLFIFRVDANAYMYGDPPMNELHIFQILDVPARKIVEILIESGANPFDPCVEDQISDLNISDAPPATTSQQSRYSTETLPSTYHRPSRSSESGSRIYTTLPRGSNASRIEEKSVLLDHTQPLEIDTDKIGLELDFINRCFDDIEATLYFLRERQSQIARRASALSAHNIVKFSTLRRKKAKPVNVEEDYLNKLRELVKDCFEKSKFAIILISRIMGFVRKPNPPDSLTALFNQLSNIQRLCRDPQTKMAEIASQVVYPLFPEETITFLHEYLDKFHLKLLAEFGPHWNTPRENVAEDEVYIPKFRKPIDIDIYACDASLFRYKTMDEEEKCLGRYIKPAELTPFARNLMDKGADIAKAIANFAARKQQEISVTKGECFELLDASHNWYKIRNSSNKVGYCPGCVLRIITTSGQTSRLNSLGSSYRS